jgi:hypothetical protein
MMTDVTVIWVWSCSASINGAFHILLILNDFYSAVRGLPLLYKRDRFARTILTRAIAAAV